MNSRTDERDSEDFYRRPEPLSKQEKLEQIRKMKAELRGEAQKEKHT
jgi:hypothetical protein